MKKTISIILLLMIIINLFYIKAQAVEIENAYIENLGLCENHLQYKKASTGQWSYVVTTMVGYRINGTIHYAYCLNVDKHGVGDVENYNVNVTEMLSDEKVWRAIINGFPYKTPAELGVANEQDAFVATKQAVYSVIYDRDVDNFYRGVDERGIQIFNALKNIVETARNSTQSPIEGQLQINKIGEFKKENNNFYSQEYSVSSNVELNNYQITNISNFPEGSYISSLSNEPKTEFAGGENFKILIPKEKILENFEGKIQINGKLKSYPIFYGKSYDSNLQDYALTYEAYSNVSGECTLDVNAYEGQIKIIKIDSETKKPISGVEFIAKYEDGTNIGKFTTNKEGIINITGLKQGKIILTETKTQKQYVLDTQDKEVTIGYDEIKEITVTNDYIKGYIKIIKKSEDDNLITGEKAGTPLENVKFEVYDENMELVDTLTTGKDGTAVTKELKMGKYFVKEVETSEYYELNENNYEIEIIKNGETVELIITNKSKVPPKEPEIPVEPEKPKLPVSGY